MKTEIDWTASRVFYVCFCIMMVALFAWRVIMIESGEWAYVDFMVGACWAFVIPFVVTSPGFNRRTRYPVTPRDL